MLVQLLEMRFINIFSWQHKHSSTKCQSRNNDCIQALPIRDFISFPKLKNED